MPTDLPDQPFPAGDRGPGVPGPGIRGGRAGPDPRAVPRRGSFRRELASFRWALRGVAAALRTEPHLRFHAAATVGVVALGAVLPLGAAERALLALAIGVVWTAELVNTAVEGLVDLVSPGLDPRAGRVKDVAAGAVLVAAVASAATGVLVLGPPLLEQVTAP